MRGLLDTSYCQNVYNLNTGVSLMMNWQALSLTVPHAHTWVHRVKNTCTCTMLYRYSSCTCPQQHSWTTGTLTREVSSECSSLVWVHLYRPALPCTSACPLLCSTPASTVTVDRSTAASQLQHKTHGMWFRVEKTLHGYRGAHHPWPILCTTSTAAQVITPEIQDKQTTGRYIHIKKNTHSPRHQSNNVYNAYP